MIISIRIDRDLKIAFDRKFYPRRGERTQILVETLPRFVVEGNNKFDDVSEQIRVHRINKWRFLRLLTSVLHRLFLSNSILIVLFVPVCLSKENKLFFLNCNSNLSIYTNCLYHISKRVR